MAMSYTSYLEGRCEVYAVTLGKVTTALHVAMQHGGVGIVDCKKGICPQVEEVLHPSKKPMTKPHIPLDQRRTV